MNNLVSNFNSITFFAEFTLAHVTAGFNVTSLVLLLAAVIAIKQKKENLHKNLIFAAFAASAAFLVFYLTRIALEGDKKFPVTSYPTVAYFYYPLLISHILLAVTVPVLAIISIYHGLKDNREQHRRIVKFTFPIWLYVSVTGVIVYLMLYWIFVAPTPEVVT